MTASLVAGRVRWTLGILFASFLLLNVVILTTAFLASLREDAELLPPHVGDEVAIGTRLVIVLVGALASWFFARMLYRLLVTHEVPPSESVGPAYSLLSYLVLVLIAYAFLGYGTWLWLPVLFVIIVVWSVLTLWSLLGFAPMIAGVLLAICGAILIWFLMA